MSVSESEQPSSSLRRVVSDTGPRISLELGLPLLIEEAAGRRSAQAAGVSISGVAGHVVRAHRQGEHFSIVTAQIRRLVIDEYTPVMLRAKGPDHLSAVALHRLYMYIVKTPRCIVTPAHTSRLSFWMASGDREGARER